MTKRLEWLEAAIKATEEWIEWAVPEAEMERGIAMPGTFDFDYSIDQLAVVERSKETLEALRVEAELIRERYRWRKSKNYD